MKDRESAAYHAHIAQMAENMAKALDWHDNREAANYRKFANAHWAEIKRLGRHK